MVKIGRAGGKTSNRETPDQIGRVGISDLSIYLSIYLSICLSILSINKSINKSQTPLRYLGGVKTAIKRLGTIECCLNGTAHAQAHVQDGFRWHKLDVINTAQNYFVKGNLNSVRKGDRLNFKIMFRSGFREFEDDPFFRLAKRR